ncbi:MAG: ornithine carbamoyltransferase [Candidatus Kryptoniota bacterium]
MKKDFISIADWSSDELNDLLNLSFKMKSSPANYYRSLEGRSVAMIFEKQSLRTHVTFDIGIYQLGAHSVYLTQADINLGKRESIYDVSKNLERWVDGVVIRTFAHQSCVDMAAYMKVPVINALTDTEHPCQALADFMTIREKFGDFKNRKLVFVGDGNNVCHSLMLMAAKLGMNFVAATPGGYEPNKRIIAEAESAAKSSGASVDIVNDPRKAVKDADVVYTDVWTSMGQESEREKRISAFRDFQVNASLMRLAKSSAIFMHCLPAHRGEEVTDDVIDSGQSAVWDESENRLYTEKAVLYTLLNG